MTQVALSNIGTFARGKGISKAQIIKGDGMPCIRYGEIYTSYGDVAHELISRVSKKDSESSFTIHAGDILFPTSGETVDEIGKAVAYLGIKTAYAGGDILILRDHGQNPAYLAYALNEWQAVKQKARLATGHSVVHLYASELGQVRIFLPPLAEQERIAEILSDVDEAIALAEKKHEAGLTRLAALRNKLIFDSGFSRKKLRGSLIQHSNRRGSIDCETVLSVNNVLGFILAEKQFGHRIASTDLSNYKVVLNGQFAYNPARLNVGSIARLSTWEQGLVSPMYVVLTTREDVLLPNFFRHWLQTHEAKQRIRLAVQGSVRQSVSFNDLCALPIPLPSIEEQSAICETLKTLEDHEGVHSRLLQALKKQKRGLMQKLLTGQWRTKDV